MKTTWVLVADEAIARILERKKSTDPLEPVKELTDAAAHADSADLRRDAYGRRASGAQPSRQNTPHQLRSNANITASAGEEEMHLEAEGFARRVAEYLADALQKQRYDELRIAAAPRFLGLLRKMMPAQVANVVIEEIDKDFIHLQARDIAERMFQDQRLPDGPPATP